MAKDLAVRNELPELPWGDLNEAKAVLNRLNGPPALSIPALKNLEDEAYRTSGAVESRLEVI